ncbi:hypothetical protein JCM9140_1375 [Halalkalibacter wakoensis JCM 9140]|uniref:Uncharacterized protein n=1 Tax=Halalkalibacter wakoensis JCM 9140 TaxID=1236970 RepID=W4Q1Y2_9BACI|nr:hypothetical protein [Halalkalibacter wakoensis]GAE25384.1 hypothetical protein JCM9140_1375 [Halalkalibacter wakoensis JCM 9140]
MKIRLFVLLITMFLGACTVSSLSISELEVVPYDVQGKIDSEYSLQLIFGHDNIAYIVYQSNGTVLTEIEAEGKALFVKVAEADQQNGAVKQHVYKVTLDPEHEEIVVFINEEPISFDNVTSL